MPERMSSIFSTKNLCDLCARIEPCECAGGPCQCTCGDCMREEPNWPAPLRADEQRPLPACTCDDRSGDIEGDLDCPMHFRNEVDAASKSGS